MRLILASQSPRRREMLALMDYEYEVIVSDANEDVPPCAPAEFVEKLAERKAEAVFSSHEDCCVIGADTIVYLDGSIIGKPKDRDDAFHDETDVTFAALSPEEIRAYIGTGEPLDKAGAYGIQGPGSLLVERVNGSYFNVIGMPNEKLYRALKEFGIYPRWMRTE